MTSFSRFRAEGGAKRIPEPGLPAAARTVQGERAGFLTRTAADVIDVLLVAGFTVFCYFATALAEFLLFPGVTLYKPDPLLFFGFGYALMWLYWTWLWGTSGKSLGKRVMGLRVVSRKGGRLGWGAASLRSLLGIVFPPGILWVALSSRNRSLPDLVVRTSVIYDWRPAAPR